MASEGGSKLRPFPVEITDAIIDATAELAFTSPTQSDARAHRKSLLSFHATSTDCHRRALVHLFNRISLPLIGGQGRHRLASLRELLNSPTSPRMGLDLVRYIKDVELKFSTAVRKNTRFPYGSQNAFSVERVINDENVALFLHQLHGDGYGIEKLTLAVDSDDSSGGWWIITKGVDWTNLSSHFRLAFQNLLQSPYLAWLDVRNFIYLPYELFRGSKVTSLTWNLDKNIVIPPAWSYQADASSVPDLNHTLSMEYPQIEYLDTNCLHRLPDTAACASVKGLKTLCVGSLAGNVPPTVSSNLLRLCGGSLKMLGLEFSGPLHFEIPDISSIPNLEVFAVTQSQLQSSPNTIPVQNIEPLAQLLNAQNPMRSLAEVHLYLTIAAAGAIRVAHPAWRAIDEALASVDVYPALCVVKVYVTFMVTVVYRADFSSKDFEEETRRYLEAQFVGCKGRERVELVLDFECDVEALEGDYNPACF
ncbi:hypothetical protein JR316_0007817 [Psilocybe cubensis]|uniref:Uncharacterized protein n=2 Tax=Psilocybe cubensis TaxID=181762 RepID=A0A8H7XSW6_PSICU|nr:hypothetical protein JR316_0007817 [Psilocybe cubensis]KAH9479229.1 hypothetical protein JR316_0007817 [Psilocybe cubensis]